MARARRRGGVAGCLLGAVAVVVGLALLVTIGGWVVLRQRGLAPPTPIESRCVAKIPDHSTVISLDQAWWASIIVGTSVNRGLPPRAASIAMATVYQETGIRNLDYGDRDSVGLFQQRPSQGWGSVEQIMDPYYASDKFYDALITVDDWQNADITKVAQEVQRSGYPEAYRDHETDGRALASTLAGWTPAAFTCSYSATGADLVGAKKFFAKTLGVTKVKQAEKTLSYTATTDEAAWALAHTAIAVGSEFGTAQVQIANRAWHQDDKSLPSWTTADSALAKRQVEITFS